MKKYESTSSTSIRNGNYMAVNKSSLPSSYRGATNIISTDGNESDS